MGSKVSISSLEVYDTLPKRLKHFSERSPAKELFVFYKGEVRQSFTAGQIYDLASKFAARLRQRGFQKNDVILNTLRNSPERLITDVGIVFAGCLPCNGQMLLASGEDLLNSAQISRAVAAVVCPREDDARWKVLKPFVTDSSSGLFGTMECSKAPDLTTAILLDRNKDSGTGCCLMDELYASTEPGFVADLKAEDTVCIMTSSGSTGMYKLIPHDHRWIHDCMVAISQLYPAIDDLPVNGSYFCDRPTGWLGGYPLGTWGVGHQRVLIDYFDEGVPTGGGQLLWNIIQWEKCTATLLVPLDLAAVLAAVKSSPGTTDHKLRCIFSGGTPIQKHHIQEYPLISQDVIPVYGATEAGFIVFGKLEDSSKDFYSGKPVHNMQVRVVDDEGRDCKVGELGEVQAKGSTVFTGYMNKLDPDDTKTKKAFTSDGWYKFDDLGYFNENNDLHVIGRKSDIIMHGFNAVHPCFLERLLSNHPDVDAAYIVPVADPVYYQNVCACVKPKSGHSVTPEGLKEYFEGAFALGYDKAKIPTPQFFMIVDEIPRTSNSKPDKRKMTSMAEDMFGTTK